MSRSPLIAAEMMARVVSQDPQFRLPAKPRFPKEFAVISIQDGLVVEGTEERQLLRGAAATTLVPRLIALLDGTRTPEELSSSMPDIPPEHIQAALALLYTRGLLEDGDGPETVLPPFANPNTVSFFRRHVDVTRLNKSAVHANSRLAQARILVVSDDSTVGEALAGELTLAGATDVSVMDKAWNDAPTECTLVVALSVTGDDSWMERVDALRIRSGVSWLRFALRGDCLEAGPYFDAESDRCFHCFSATSPERRHTLPQPWAKELLVSTATTEAVYILTQVVSSRIVNEMTVMQLAKGALTRHKVVRVPGCSHCLPGLPATDHLPTPLIYEDAVDLPPKRLVNLKQHQVHYSPHNIALQKLAKRYPNARSLPLPAVMPSENMTARDLLAPDNSQQPDRVGDQQINLGQLSTLLLCTGGIKHLRPDGIPARWASTGGNLGSVGLYVIARNVDGLAPGLYYYSSFEHRLAELPTPDGGVLTVEQVCGEAAGPLSHAAALIVLSGSYGRMSSKYHSLGYRLLHLDAGVGVSQALAVASACGVMASVLPSWNDEILHSSLQIDGFGELVTGVIAVFGQGDDAL